MTLFRVHCPTCSARLKVKSRSLIGQIVNCPKCGSMIEVAEPESAEVDEKAKTVAETVPVAPAAEPSSTPENVSNSDAIFDNLDEMLDSSPAEPAPEAAVQTSPTAAESSPEVNRFSDQASVSKWRSFALIGGTSVMAIVTFAVIGYAVFSEGEENKVPPNTDPEPIQVAQFESPEQEATLEQEEVTTPPEATEPIKKPAVAPKVEEGLTTEEKGSQDPSMAPPIEEKPKELIKSREENPFLFDEPDAAKPAATMQNEDTDTEPKEEALAKSSPSILELKDDPLYEVFGESFPIFDPEMIEQSAATTPNAAESASIVPPVEAATTPQLVPRIPEVDVAKRLQDPIVKIEFEGMPLNRFTSFVTQMSTVPVTIDPVALASANISATTPISVSQTQTSVQGILDAAVRPHGLEVHATDKSARLSITQPLDGHMRAARLLVDDLAQDPKQVADVAYLLTHVVEPLSWNQSRGEGAYRVEPGAITVRQGEIAQFKAIVFLEKLRVARGLKPRSSYPAELFRLTPRSKQLEPALQKDVKIQIVVPTPMYKVIDQLEKKSGLTILCDWDSLALNKIGPATPVTLSAPGMIAGQAIEQFCQAWKLAALPISQNTVQLVSEQSVPVLPWLEFYAVDNLQLDKTQAAALINNAKRELRDLRKTGYGDLQYDPVSKHLLALLSKDDHQRLQFFLQRASSN